MFIVKKIIMFLVISILIIEPICQAQEASLVDNAVAPENNSTEKVEVMPTEQVVQSSADQNTNALSINENDTFENQPAKEESNGTSYAIDLSKEDTTAVIQKDAANAISLNEKEPLVASATVADSKNTSLNQPSDSMSTATDVALVSVAQQPVSAVSIETPPSSAVLESNKIDTNEMLSTSEEPVGIDTVSLQEPQGNWLFKRIWWERAQERYEKIRALVDQIWEFRMGFFLSRSEIDRTKLDPFYVYVGFGQGELQQVLTDLIATIEIEAQKEGVLDVDERTLLANAQEQKKILEDLRVQVDAISQLDHSIDTALERLMEQINRVRTYENEAWKDFKEIAQVLSDTKARELYYKMDSGWRNIKDIHKYLQQDFVAHFQEITKKISSEIERVKQVVEGLKEKGLDLKKQSEHMLSMHKKEPITVVDSEDQEDQEPIKKGFISSIYNAATDGFFTFLNAVTYPFVFVYQKVFGSVPAPIREQEQEDN